MVRIASTTTCLTASELFSLIVICIALHSVESCLSWFNSTIYIYMISKLKKHEK